MVKIILVSKFGELKETKVKLTNCDELYKKASLKKSDGFECRTIWKVKLDIKYNIELWAREDGKAGMENKYDFPPPVDEKLYFGTCILVNKDSNNSKELSDITLDTWNQIYEKLFGGFEDLNDNEELSEDELDDIPLVMKTRDGYLKDGFICEDRGALSMDEEEDEDDEEDFSDEGNENIIVNRQKNVSDSECSDHYIDNHIISELAPEKYIYSDEDE